MAEHGWEYTELAIVEEVASARSACACGWSVDLMIDKAEVYQAARELWSEHVND